ncbi:MAG: bile acid:sodium symporter family protein [Phycisphaerae bacterium]|nr:bile acid:sodium symporter family protein [Phycisphaerae bacterium]
MSEQTQKQNPFKIVLHWYTKLFAVWIVLFAVVGYFFPQPFEFLANYKMFGAAAEKWPVIFQSLRIPNTWFFALTMFGIGAVLTVNDFKNIAKRPVIVLIGSVAQFTIMPLGAFALARLFHLPPMLAAGLIIAGCAPGAMSSNVMSYIAKADVAYSVSLTTVSTLLCPILTPALAKLLAGATMPVDFWKMFADIVFMVVLPLGAGFAVRHFFSAAVEKVKDLFPAISVTFIIFICTLVIANNREKMLHATAAVITVVLLLNIYGMAAGYGVGALFKMPFSQKRTLSIEIGMQNAGLGTVLAIEHFGPEAAIPTAFFVFACIITASIMTEIWKSKKRKGEFCYEK